MSSSDDDDESNHAPRERSASYAGSKTLELLGELGSAKHAGRIKALKRFQEYITKYRPELYDDDVELLYVVRGSKSAIPFGVHVSGLMIHHRLFGNRARPR